MKKILGLVMAVALLGGLASAQMITNYNFAPTSGTFTPIVGGTVIAPKCDAGGAPEDDGAYNYINLGFTFWYMGMPYTAGAASTNGFFTFASDSINIRYVGTTGIASNDLSILERTQRETPTVGDPIRPLLMPFGDDMIMASANGAQFSYITEGTPGSRVTTIEWLNQGWDYSAAQPVMSYQIKLYEIDMRIEFVYRPEAGAPVGTLTAAIGICGVPLGSGNYLHLSDPGVAPTVSSTVPVYNFATRPADGQVYSFTPQFIVTPADPINISFVDNNPTSIDVSWTDNSTTETYFEVEKSPDGVVWSYLTTVASTTQGAIGAVYTITETGLLANTTYYYRVCAGNEASTASGWLSGNHTTLPFNNVTATVSGAWSTPATWSSLAVPTINDNVTIDGGFIVSLDAAGLCQDLTIGGVAAGTLSFSTPNALTVNGSLYVNVNGTISSAVVGGTLIVGGNTATGGSIVNDGAMDLTSTGLQFNGANNTTWTGIGGNTISTITMNKGTDRTFIMDVQPTSFTAVGTNGSFYITTSQFGTLKMSGTFVYSGRPFITTGGSPRTITQRTGGFWMNNPNFTAQYSDYNPGSFVNAGLLRISDGVWTMGQVAGNAVQLGNSSSFWMDGGSFTTTGSLRAAAAGNDSISFTMTGGDITLATVGNVGTGQGPFDIRGAASRFTMSGGTIHVKHPNASTTPWGWRNTVGAFSITGGSVEFGDAVTARDTVYIVSGRVPTVTFANAAIETLKIYPTSGQVPTANYFRVYFNTTIPANKVLHLNGREFRSYGQTLTNNGLITGGSGSTITFCNALGLYPDQNFYFNNNGAVALTNGRILNWNDSTFLAGNPFAVNWVYMYQGGIANANLLTIGDGVNISLLHFEAYTGYPFGFDVTPAMPWGLQDLEYAGWDIPVTMGSLNEVPAPSKGIRVIDYVECCASDVTMDAHDLYTGQVDFSTASWMSGYPYGYAGHLITGSQMVVVDSTTGNSGYVNESVANGYIVGNTQTTRLVGIGVAENFFGIGSSLANVLDDLGDVTVIRYTGALGQRTSFGDTSISRTFWVQSTNPPATGCDLTMNWIADDVPAGYDQTQMQVWRSPNGLDPWSPFGPIFDGTGMTTTLVGVTQFSEWTVADINNPLPVELLSFNVQAQETEKKVSLTWSTASEKNTYQWQIERSTDAKTGFVGIATLNAAGNSASKIDYQYTDEFNLTSGQEYFYRLASVSQSGSRSFFGPIKISVAKPGCYALASAYPNPFSDKSTIKYQLKDAGKVSLKVYNLTGQLVKTLVNAPQNADFYSVRWNGSNEAGKKVAAGLYLYRLEVNGFSAIKKAAILR